MNSGTSIGAIEFRLRPIYRCTFDIKANTENSKEHLQLYHCIFHRSRSITVFEFPPVDLFTFTRSPPANFTMLAATVLLAAAHLAAAINFADYDPQPGLPAEVKPFLEA